MRELDTYLAITNKTILQDARYTHGRDTDPRTNCPSHMFSANLRLAWFHANVHSEWNGRTGWQGGREREREESRGGLFKKLIIPLGWINVRVVRARSCKRRYRPIRAVAPDTPLAIRDQSASVKRGEWLFLKESANVIIDPSVCIPFCWFRRSQRKQRRGLSRSKRQVLWIPRSPDRFLYGFFGVSNGIDANYTSKRNFPSSSICRVEIQLEEGVCTYSAWNYTNYQHLLYQREDSEQFCWGAIHSTLYVVLWFFSGESTDPFDTNDNYNRMCSLCNYSHPRRIRINS